MSGNRTNLPYYLVKNIKQSHFLQSFKLSSFVVIKSQNLESHKIHSSSFYSGLGWLSALLRLERCVPIIQATSTCKLYLFLFKLTQFQKRNKKKAETKVLVHAAVVIKAETMNPKVVYFLKSWIHIFIYPLNIDKRKCELTEAEYKLP